MSDTWLYRICALALVLFAAGHTLGFLGIQGTHAGGHCRAASHGQRALHPGRDELHVTEIFIAEQFGVSYGYTKKFGDNSYRAGG